MIRDDAGTLATPTLMPIYMPLYILLLIALVTNSFRAKMQRRAYRRLHYDAEAGNISGHAQAMKELLAAPATYTLVAHDFYFRRFYEAAPANKERQQQRLSEMHFWSPDCGAIIASREKSLLRESVRFLTPLISAGALRYTITPIDTFSLQGNHAPFRHKHIADVFVSLKLWRQHLQLVICFLDRAKLSFMLHAGSRRLAVSRRQHTPRRHST